MIITVVPGGASEPWGGGQGRHQADYVQDGGQQPDDRGVGQGGQLAGETMSF